MTDLKNRIAKATLNIRNGVAAMHYPPRNHDADLVLDECLERINELEVELAQVGMGDWISVKDHLPEKGKPVLVWCSTFKEAFKRSFPLASDITHWQPLPNQPIQNTEISDHKKKATNYLHRTKVNRSENGEWIHPELGKYWEINFGGDVEDLDVEQWEELKRYFNIDTITFDLESCVSEKVYEKMMDSCDLSKWKPIPPNHYFLISINYTEDGASAVFAKQKSDV